MLTREEVLRKLYRRGMSPGDVRSAFGDQEEAALEIIRALIKEQLAYFNLVDGCGWIVCLTLEGDKAAAKEVP